MTRCMSVFLTVATCFISLPVNAQYYQWQQQPQYYQPQQYQQQQQFQPQYYQPQYFPQQQQQQIQQPIQYQPQQQQFAPQPQMQQPQPPIYSQTVVIPEAPPPPPEAYQAQQYAPQQIAPVMVRPADIPRYHIRPTPTDLQHVERARSVQAVELDNKLFREQPNSFAQNQEKIELLAQPPPPPPPPSSPTQMRVPPPPARFIPSLRQLHNIDSSNDKKYRPDEIVVDGHHSYFEDTQRTRPQSTKVRGGSVASSSAAVPRPSAAVIASPPQQSFVKPPTASSTNSHTRPIQRPVTRRPSVSRVHPSPPPHPTASIRQPAISAELPKPKTASEKFLQCCKTRKVNKSCERICSFDVLSKKTLTGMFLGTDPCPQTHGIDLMQCAADSDDHTQCCVEKGVDRTSAGKKCLGFCNMKPGITFQADVSMLPCWGVLNDIKQCFKENLERQLAAN